MKRIGIMGGMGPMATVDLMKKIILLTNAKVDQEHVPILVDNMPQIPDRTKAIIGQAESPVPAMVASAKRLENGGSDFIVIACNTAHYFLSEVQKEINIPIISIVDAAVKCVKSRKLKIVGLLGTKGTISAGIYQKKLVECGIKCVVPSEEEQVLVDGLIYDGVKANDSNYNSKPVEDLLTSMQDQGVDCFILGCTEMPLAVSMYNMKGNFIDSTMEIARTAVRMAGGKLWDPQLKSDNLYQRNTQHIQR